MTNPTKDITINGTKYEITIPKERITDFPTLANVATSGSYEDLTNKPTIPTIPEVATTTTDGLMSSADKEKLNGIDADANNYTHPDTHPASMITGLSTVATSGSYNDLTDKPTNSSGFNTILEDNTLTTESEEFLIQNDNETETLVKVDHNGLAAKAYLDLQGNNVIPTQLTIFQKSNPLFNKKVYVMGTSNDNTWPQYLQNITGCLWLKDYHKYTNCGGTFAGDIGGPEYGSEDWTTDEKPGGSRRAKNFVKISDSTYENPDYVFVNSQNNDIAIWDEFNISINTKASADGTIVLHYGPTEISIDVTTSMTIYNIATAISNAIKNANRLITSTVKNNNINIQLKFGDSNDTVIYDRDIVVYIDTASTGVNYNVLKIKKEDIIRTRLENADPIMYSQYITVDSETYNYNDAEAWLEENIATVVANFAEPKPYSVIHLQYSSPTKVFTLTGTSTAGTVTIKVNDTTVATSTIEAGKTATQVVSLIYSDTAEEFINTAWLMSVSSNTIKFAFTSPNNGASSDVITIDVSLIGLTSTLEESDNITTRPKWYKDRDVTDFTTYSKWLYMPGYTDFEGYMKGIIEYIQVNKPFTKIVLYQTPSRQYKNDRLRVDGTYDVETQKKVFRELTFAENKEIFMQALGDYYGILYINVLKQITGIANIRNLYAKENDVHYNTKMHYKIAVVLANNVK